METLKTFVRLSLVAKDAKCEVPSMVPSYIDNLLRLGLIYEKRPWATHVTEVSKFRDSIEDRHAPGFYYRGERIGELIDEYPELQEIEQSFSHKHHLEIWMTGVQLTEFGKAFCRVCVGLEDSRGLLVFGAQGERLINNRIQV